MTDPVLLAVAHGSRDERAAPALDRLIERVRAGAPEVDVRLSYVDHTSPSVTRALEDLSTRPTVVVPLLLTAASHTKGDVAAAVRAARRPDRHLHQARPLAPHPGLLAALDRRLDEAGVDRRTAVVLAAVGSADPDANADVVADARRLWEWRRASAPVEAGFASATTPTVAEAVDRLRRLGYDEVAVAAYALAPGRLLDKATAGLDVATVTEELADTPEAAEVVLERYREAIAGDIRMGCDTCLYRVGWPGREDRQGAPQRVHPHPDDA
ncbi:MAG TPA: CbiX/SirB N-terminal domain-containing protein [Mycobacteriales bacterium]|jgi:sirohydrochlorin cobaltochelatase